MPRKTNTIKAFCAELNSVIHVRRLTDRVHKLIFNKLTKFVKSSKSGEFDFVSYVKIIVGNCVTSDEKRVFVDRLEEAAKVKDAIQDPMLEYKLLGAYYSTIVEYYPEFRIEYICYEINELLPDSIILENLKSPKKI